MLVKLPGSANPSIPKGKTNNNNNTNTTTTTNNNNNNNNKNNSNNSSNNNSSSNRAGGGAVPQGVHQSPRVGSGQRLPYVKYM